MADTEPSPHTVSRRKFLRVTAAGFLAPKVAESYNPKLGPTSERKQSDPVGELVERSIANFDLACEILDSKVSKLNNENLEEQKKWLKPAADIDTCLQVPISQVPDYDASEDIQHARLIDNPVDRLHAVIGALGIETREKFDDPEYLAITQQFNSLRERSWTLDVMKNKVLSDASDKLMGYLGLNENNKNLPANSSKLRSYTSAMQRLGKEIDAKTAQKKAQIDEQIGQALDAQHQIVIARGYSNPRFTEANGGLACNKYAQDVVGGLGHGEYLPAYNEEGDEMGTQQMEEYLKKNGEKLGWKRPKDAQEVMTMMQEGYYFVGVMYSPVSGSGHAWIAYGNRGSFGSSPEVSQASFNSASEPVKFGRDYKCFPSLLWGRKIVSS